MPTLRLAAILNEGNAEEAQAALKKFRRDPSKTGKASLHEVQQLDRQLITACGTGLSKFIPSYFKDGVKAMHPGCFSDGCLELFVEWSRAPLLRIVADRESSMCAAQAFLASRLRVVEVSDPCHVLWRACQLGVEHAGCKGLVATLTVAMNAFKGHLGRTWLAPPQNMQVLVCPPSPPLCFFHGMCAIGQAMVERQLWHRTDRGHECYDKSHGR